jgi:TonB family protein
VAQENNDVARRLEELRRRRAEIEQRRREVEAAKAHEVTSGGGTPPERPHTAPRQEQRPPKRKTGLLIGLVIVCVAVAAVLTYVLTRPPGTVTPGEVAERGETPDVEQEAARIAAEEQERAMLQARLDSLAALADSLSQVAGRADDLEKQLDDVEDEQAGLRRQLDEERRRRESEAREKQRLERELTETQATVATLEQEAAQSAEPPGTEEPVQVASLREGEGTAAERSQGGDVTGAGATAARLASLAELDGPPQAQTRVDAAQLARQRNVPITSGRVLLRVLVGPTGAVEDVQVVRSLTQALDQVAAEAMRGWTFTPPTASGQPVRAWIRIPVVF